MSRRPAAPVSCWLPLLAGATAAAQNLEPPATAKACGRSHGAIHQAWKQSAHARAIKSRLFQDAVELAELDFGLPAR